MAQTVVSCPGKVLMAGGYLVLDRTYTGMVVGTRSRFYTIVTPPSERELQRCSQLILVVESPQFLEAQWSYRVRHSESEEVDLVVEQISDPNGSCTRNKFVELAVRESLRLSIALQDDHCMFTKSAESEPNGQLEILHKFMATILGDNDFYSQARENATPPVPFNRLHTTLAEVHKTGLGSSAAMVTSLCSAILLHFTPSLDVNAKATKLILHNLSQYVHCLAQGKVGSGFDVSAAVWGSHVYRRFSPCCLDGLLGLNESQISPKVLRDTLNLSINSAWADTSTAPEVKHFVIPRYTTLLLADVDAGSHTPSMVGKVLKWKASQKDVACKLWDEISEANNQLKEAFKRLEELSSHHDLNYLTQLTQISQDTSVLLQTNTNPVTQEDDVKTLFVKASSAMKETRKLMKDMGDKSDVPIEPDTQTRLLNECEKIQGVIASGVPGAGGFDAVWVLALSPPDHPTGAINNILELWNNWSEVSVKSLSSESWVVGGSQPAQNDGLQVLQSADHVKGFNPSLISRHLV